MASFGQTITGARMDLSIDSYIYVQPREPNTSNFVISYDVKRSLTYLKRVFPLNSLNKAEYVAFCRHCKKLISKETRVIHRETTLWLRSNANNYASS